MNKVYSQPYNGKKEIACWYGVPPKGHFKYDVIRIELPVGDDIWLTPDEAADLIRALSAGLHHWLVKSEITKRIIKAKYKY
jgi:hypothetical protein